MVKRQRRNVLRQEGIATRRQGKRFYLSKMENEHKASAREGEGKNHVGGRGDVEQN